MVSFFAEHWVVIMFYTLVILGLVVFRKKFEFQGKIVALMRTNWGVEWMQKYGEKHAKLIQRLGYTGIFVGFVGMITIVGFLLYGLWQLFASPSSPPVISPVLPGVQVPGSPIAFPLFETIIALFIVIVVHEAAHGLVAAAHKIKVESSGLLMLGPIFGAFVEPDEKKLPKMPHKVQHSIYAAGPFSNVLLAILFLGLWFGFVFAVASMITPMGMTFSQTVPQSPAALANLSADATYVQINGMPLSGASDLMDQLTILEPGDNITLTSSDNRTFALTLGAHPDNPQNPWMGIEGVETVISEEGLHPWLFAVLSFIASTLYWVFVLSLGLGLANLMPLGPVDGGRMWQLVLHKWVGKEKGDLIWSKSSMVVLLIVLILLLVPIGRELFMRAVGA